MRNLQLQAGTQSLLARYGEFASHMLTLTLNDGTGYQPANKGTGNETTAKQVNWNVSDTAIKKATQIFIKKLNSAVWKRWAEKPMLAHKCQIIAIPVFEGMNSDKRSHVHMLLGNIAKEKQPELESLIKIAWQQTAIGMSRMHLSKISDLDGAAFYLAKEVGYINNDAVDWNIASIPSVLYTKPSVIREKIADIRARRQAQALLDSKNLR